MMENLLHYAYIDESGNVATSRGNHILVVAALCTSNTLRVSRVIRHVQKKLDLPLPAGELKAKKSSEEVVIRVLGSLSEEPIEVFAIVINRQIIEHAPKDPEDIYRWAVTRIIASLVHRYPRIEVVLDRRYTKENLRNRLEKEIRRGISDLPQNYVLIRQEDSATSKELQAVDFIAWSFLQKYEHSNNEFYDLIATKVVVEECITKRTWETEHRKARRF